MSWMLGAPSFAWVASPWPGRSAGGKGNRPPPRRPHAPPVESPEHPMPVSVVALGAPDGAPRGGRVPTLAAQRGQGQHFLVHAVRLGVLHEEVSPMAAA